jgi:hypothetical protein
MRGQRLRPRAATLKAESGLRAEGKPLAQGARLHPEITAAVIQMDVFHQEVKLLAYGQHCEGESFAMAELAKSKALSRKRKSWRWLKHLAFASVGILTSVAPVMACDGSLPPLSALARQKALVESLHAYLGGVRDEEKVGQRSVYEIMEAEKEYSVELETLRAMEACKAAGKENPRGKILQARVKSASDHLAALKSWQSATEDRFQVGEVTNTDVALVRAVALKAEIRLATLKREAGQ